MATIGLHYGLNRFLLGWLRSHFYDCMTPFQREKYGSQLETKYTCFLEPLSDTNANGSHKTHFDILKGLIKNLSLLDH